MARLWKPEETEPVRLLKGHEKTLYGSAFHPSGRRVATSCAAGRVCVWDVATGERLRTMEAGARVSYLAFGADGTFLFGGGRTGVHVWEAASGERLPDLPGYEGPVVAMNLHPAGHTLAAACSDGAVRVWSLPGRELAHTFRLPEGDATAVALHPARPLLAAADKEGDLAVWDLGSRELLQVADAGGHVYALCFDKGGGLLASGGADKAIRLWKVRGERR